MISVHKSLKNSKLQENSCKEEWDNIYFICFAVPHGSKYYKILEKVINQLSRHLALGEFKDKLAARYVQ